MQQQDLKKKYKDALCHVRQQIHIHTAREPLFGCYITHGPLLDELFSVLISSHRQDVADVLQIATLVNSC